MKKKNHAITLLTLLLHQPIITTSLSTYGTLELFFYQTSGSTSWKNSKNWLQNTNPCTWYGITCHNTDFGGGVERIELVDNNLQGTIPSEIFQIDGLRSLNIGDNENVDVDFSFVGEARMLEHLRLDKTGVGSLKGINGVKDTLTTLSVSNNDLGSTSSGVIEEEIYELTKLKTLNLAANSLGGSISHRIGELTMLQELDLSSNMLSGTLPTQIGLLTELVSLSLDENALEGTLPSELNELVNLEGLFLNHQVVGFEGPLIDFAGLKMLTEMNLRRNKLTGTVPSTFLSSSTVSQRQIYISLSYNRLTGTVPSSLSRFPRLNLYLVSNYFTAIAPELCSLDEWMDGLVKTAGCNALLCPLDTYNEYGRQIDRSTVCQDCDDSVTEHLGAFSCHTKEKFDYDILEELYQATDGDSWLAKTNWLRQKVSICEWFGIICDDDGNVVKIDLSGNNLSGSFHSRGVFEGFPRLQKLILNGNPDLYFTPEGIWKANDLQVLQLNRLGLTSLAGISEAKSLTTLHISNNNFLDNPMEEIVTLTNLEHLTIANGNITGRLHSISSLSNLLTLDLSSNALSGSIPATISSLNELITLDLSNNHLTGTLPPVMEDMKALSSLKLNNQIYRNGITGPLLAFATTTNLNYLDLSSNAFTGTLPTNFLASMSPYSTDDNVIVTINLADNSLSGSIPSTFSKFINLNLYLTGNEISYIPEQICTSSTKWMNGDVSKYGCDAILCPIGTINDYGRQTRNAKPCINCGTGQTTLHMGEVSGSNGSAAGCVDIPRVDEKSILKNFYYSLSGENWIRNDHWDSTDVDVCEWYGLTCKNGYVTEINLDNNGLFGTPSTDIYSLTFLEKIDVSLNSLVYFDFQGVENAVRLREMNIHGVGLASMEGIGKAASSLRVLKAGRNDFHGNDIPPEIYQLRNLEYLYIAESNLGGVIDTAIGNLIHLNGLYAYGNELTGSIPTTISKLTNLTWMALGQNSLTGTLPPQFEQLKHLKALSLVDQTSKGGEGLTGPLLSFFTNLDLTELFLSKNHFTGTIPSTLLEISDATRPYSIDFSSNDLVGSVPLELERFDVLHLDVTDNRITHIDSKLCEKPKWMYGNVEQFGCDAILCPAGTSSAIGRQEVETEGCQACSLDMPDVDSLDLPLGAKNCALMPHMDHEREVMIKLYHACGGDEWTNTTNWLDETVGVCWWHGILCDKYGSIEKILLGGNNLVGTPPKEIFELESLETLSLYSNPIDSFSFDGIENAKKLQRLALDSTGLTSIDGISAAAKTLTNLNLRFNRLKGGIPDEIYQLSALEFLTLSDNYFTGTISSSFGNLVNMRTLLIGSNKLTGAIYDFANNTFLTYLDLSNNMLTGSIPSTMLSSTNPLSKAFFDLSTNKLTGTLPATLARFDNLAIHLKDNKFEGPIPDELCQMSKWNYYDVNNYGCDGILCPIGTYNSIGRQSNNETPCLECDSAKFLGSSECGDELSSSSSSSSGLMFRRHIMAPLLAAISMAVYCL